MDFSKLTDPQRLCVTTVDKPLFVAAGAGSGKTHMLTQRIVNAITDETSGVSDVDQILAITFTTKAAAEIRARVKGTLRMEGQIEQALKTDGAWISTIHGMCSRILHQNALELGIDPKFTVAEERESTELLRGCIQEVLGRNNELADGVDSLLRREYPYNPNSPNYSYPAFIERAVRSAASALNGFDDIVCPPKAESPSVLLRKYDAFLGRFAAWHESQKEGKNRDKGGALLDAKIKSIAQLIDDGGLSSDEHGYLMLAEAIVERQKYNYGSKDERQALRGEEEEILSQITAGYSRAVTLDLVDVSRAVATLFEKRKFELGVLDNDDLIAMTYRAIRDNSSIRERFADRFRLVMVDEFQDTDPMQLALISLLSGESCNRLCTVGDAQQSIYRFRGSDVRVFDKHRIRMQEGPYSVDSVCLDVNFRSHPDILAFVDRVFARKEAFGSSFMHLDPCKLKRKNEIPFSGPRIRMFIAEGNAGAAARIKQVADDIAESFFQLQEEGHKPGEMVVLLKRMTKASVFAEALRSRGFNCAIAGGSTFYGTPEARSIASLASLLANRTDDAALFEVAISPYFDLGADDLLLLGTKYNDRGARVKRRLSEGLSCWEDIADDTTSPKLKLFKEVMEEAWEQVAVSSLSQAAASVVLRSGYYERMEQLKTQGTAPAANTIKALRLLAETEKSYLAPRGTAAGFASLVHEGAKEKPGSLSGAGDDVVRIMTVHASKGLEFPIVAVAEFGGKQNPSNLTVERIEDGFFISCLPGSSTRDDYPVLKEIVDSDSPSENDLLTCSEASSFIGMLRAFSAEQSAEEEKRLLYVALTRASEALVLGISEMKPVTSLLTDALAPDGVEEGISLLDFGGDSKAIVSKCVLDKDAGEAVSVIDSDVVEEPAFAIPAPVKSPLMKAFVQERRDKRFFSYSSLGAHVRFDRSLHQIISVDSSTEEQKSIAPRTQGPNVEATVFGTAFHRLAQEAVVTGTPPTPNRIDDVARSLSKDSEDIARRLSESMERWLSSNVRKQVESFESLRAEVPFCIPIGELCLEGEIDLLAQNGINAPAFVVDYKTGGSSAESIEDLYDKHALQATCYAAAVLGQGHPSVQVAFVRVEREDPSGSDTLQSVFFDFEQKDCPDLLKTIEAIRESTVG